MKDLFLGVDGGQSSTTALLGDATGRVLGVGVAGPCNHVGASPEGREKFARVIAECVAQAAGSPRPRLAAACFGMSGGPADKRAILEQVLDVQHLMVTTDAVIALAGATEGSPGIITIAGTGSIAFGRNARGRSMRAGGWGYIFGDGGGAFDIVRQALRAALRAEEGWGPPTALRQSLIAATGAADANDLLHRFYTQEWPRSRIARLAPLVDATAGSGDACAQEVLKSAARELTRLAGSIREGLWRAGDQPPIAYIGGVFRSSMVLENFRDALGPGVMPPRHGPAAGALLEAYAAAGLHPTLSGVPALKG